MPLPVLYIGTQDDDRTRSIDVAHIEPSIREGVHLVSSLYGRDASSPLYRFPPTNAYPPYLTGPEQIPGRLVCNSGQWMGSPTPVLTYQWMRNGIDVLGETNYEYFTVDADDTATFTCEVKGTNYMGEDYALSSNSIQVTLIEPVEIGRQEDYIISAISANRHQTIIQESEVIVTGVGTLDRMDVNRGVAYYLTGISADDRHDLNQAEYNIITGLNQNDTMAIMERTYGVGVISRTIGSPLIEGVPEALPLKNPQAEFGTFGWFNYGAIFANDYFEGVNSHASSLFWAGGNNVDITGSNTPYSYMEQDVPMYAPHYADIDAGLCFLELYFYQNSTDVDQAGIKFEFYSNTMALVGVSSGSGLMNSPYDIWYLRDVDIAIPPLTRFIRIIPEFLLVSGTNVEAYIDSISMKIRKGDIITDRTGGPSYNYYRVRFLQANTWSGAAVSEIEFRGSEGGLDLCNGGTPVFGSAGLGVANADYAFDDLRNTGYWAGAANSITDGTAWVGYNFPAPVRPVELNITARSGSDAYMVGKQFYVECSDDGLRWVKQQYYPEIINPLFNTNEQRSFPIASGTITKAADYYTGAGFDWVRDPGSTDNANGKGNLYQAWCRFDITHLCVKLNQQLGVTFDYEIQLYRCSTQKNGGFANSGMIVELLETVTATSDPVNVDSWVTLPLVGVHEMNVGDYFLVRFWDTGIANNVEGGTSEARTFFINGFNDEPVEGNPIFANRKHIAFRVQEWAGGNQVMSLGETNPSSYNTGQGQYWGVDFHCTVV